MGVTSSRTDEYSTSSYDTSSDHPAAPTHEDFRPETPTRLTNDDPNAASLNGIATTEFVWSFGGHSVYVTGAWDDWRVKAALNRTSPSEFTAILALPVGTFQYKFIVDGNWKHSPALPTERDQHGNLNNIVVVKPQVPEYDSNDFVYPDVQPTSPVDSYDYSIIPQEDHNTEPPTLPRLLATAPIDCVSPCSGSDFVRFNHVFTANTDSNFAPYPVRTMAVEHRYKAKVITTILITMKNKQSLPLPIPIRPQAPEEHLSPFPSMGTTQSLIMDALNNV